MQLRGGWTSKTQLFLCLVHLCYFVQASRTEETSSLSYWNLQQWFLSLCPLEQRSTIVKCLTPFNIDPFNIKVHQMLEVEGANMKVMLSWYLESVVTYQCWQMIQFLLLLTDEATGGFVVWCAIEVLRRKWLEENPEASSNSEPVLFETSTVPWWAWVKRFHLPEAELLNGSLSYLYPLPECHVFQYFFCCFSSQDMKKLHFPFGLLQNSDDFLGAVSQEYICPGGNRTCCNDRLYLCLLGGCCNRGWLGRSVKQLLWQAFAFYHCMWSAIDSEEQWYCQLAQPC